VIVPLPERILESSTRIQSDWLAAPHVQPWATVTVALPDPPDGPNAFVGSDTEYEHEGETGVRCSGPHEPAPNARIRTTVERADRLTFGLPRGRTAAHTCRVGLGDVPVPVEI
jgi:hypothetical protein